MTTAPHSMKRSSITVLALAALLLASAGAQGQSTWYVDDDGTRLGGCASWEDACPDLQTALGLADSGDEIRVAQGVYKPTDQDGNRAATFELIDGVAMRGGYLGLSAGKTQDPDERDVELYETILSGDLDGDDGPDFENNDENSFHVVTADNTNAGTVLDGFTIRAGHAEIFGDNHGGGMHNLNASPTVTHCTFTSNAARGDLSRGGAIYNRGTQAIHSAPTITGCTFVGNMVESVGAATTKGWGGAICNIFGDAAISNCTFEGNRAVGNVAMGGAVVNSDSDARIVDCTFSGNIATGLGAAGGAMGNRGGLGFLPTLVRCAFTENHAVPMAPFNDSIGGALANFSDVKLIDCTLVGNTAAAGPCTITRATWN